MPSNRFLPIGVKGARITINQEDAEVHEGNRFTVLHEETIGASGVSSICITTNCEKKNFMTFGLDTTKAGEWILSEGAVCSGGTVLTAYNNNRQSDKVCDCIITAGVNIATVGTVLGVHVVGASTGGSSKSGGSTSGRNEWVLKQDTSYLLRFIAVSADTIVVQGLYFYEGETEC